MSAPIPDPERQVADYVATAECAQECGGDHGQDMMSYPFHARGCPVEKELRPYWEAMFVAAQVARNTDTVGRSLCAHIDGSDGAR